MWRRRRGPGRGTWMSWYHSGQLAGAASNPGSVYSPVQHDTRYKGYSSVYSPVQHETCYKGYSIIAVFIHLSNMTHATVVFIHLFSMPQVASGHR